MMELELRSVEEGDSSGPTTNFLAKIGGEVVAEVWVALLRNGSYGGIRVKMLNGTTEEARELAQDVKIQLKYS